MNIELLAPVETGLDANFTCRLDNRRIGSYAARDRILGHPVRSELVFPASTFARLRKAMLGARTSGNEEVLGFALCTRHRAPSLDRYLVREWLVPEPGDYEHQSAGGLTLKQSFHLKLLLDHLTPGSHLLHLHTHPGRGTQWFSATDDADEVAQSAALLHLPGSPRLLSGVFDRDMTTGSFRIWSGKYGNYTVMNQSQSWIPSLDHAGMDSERFDRQRIFGDGVQGQLAQLTVALIGCGGLGAPFAEQLSRLGVRSWVLIDDDRIDVTNLHRLPFSTPGMAERGKRKVDYGEGLIQRFWSGDARVRKVAGSITEPSAQAVVAEADLIVVATDNHHSRLLAQEVALRHLRPLLCLGTEIERREDEEQPRIYSRVTMPPWDGGWCLPCAGVIDLTTAARESADVETRSQLKEAGYLPGVHAPAVFWVNTIGAAMGVRLIHGALAGFVDTANGVDEIFDLASGMWMPVDHETTNSCYFCGQRGLLAAGPVP